MNKGNFNNNQNFDQGRIDSDKLMDAASPIETEDSMASLIKKVLISKYLMIYPDWMLAYPIPFDTVPSSLPAATAYFRANELKKNMRIGVHPVNAIENLLVKSEVTMVGDVLQYVDPKEKKAVIVPNNRGYHIIEEKNTAAVVAAAYPADCIPYYARGDGKGSASPTVTDEFRVSLKIKTLNTRALRVMLTPYISSETMARDAIYKYMELYPEQAFGVTNQLCVQHPTYAGKSEVAMKFYTEARTKDTKLKELPAILLPIGGKNEQLSYNCGMDDMYLYLSDCRLFRGEDNGLGSLTFGYMWGACTRSVVKNITNFLDIRQLLFDYGTDVLCVMGRLPEFVKRMCIANGYFILEASNVNGQALTAKLYKDRAYDVYTSVSAGIKYGMLYLADSVPPTIKSNGTDRSLVVYKDLNLQSLFNSKHDATNVVFQAVRTHLHPQMRKEKFGYQVLPCALPHNGVVIVSFPIIKKFDINNLIKRTFDANHLRNNWLINRRSWVLLDPYSGQCKYMDSYKIPKMVTRTRKQVTLWSEYFAEVAEERKLTISTSDLNIDERVFRKGATLDIDMSMQELADFLQSTGSVRDSLVSLFKQWGEARENSSLRIMRLRGMTQQEVAQALISKLPNSEKDIVLGMQALMKFRAEIELKKAQSPPPPSDVVPREEVITPITLQNQSAYANFNVVEDGRVQYGDDEYPGFSDL